MVLRNAKLPEEFAFEEDWSSEPAFFAARTSEGWMVAGVQRGVRTALALFTPELEPRRAHVLATGRDCAWRSARPIALPDGRCLLSVEQEFPGTYELDQHTLELGAAPDWGTLESPALAVTQVFALDDRVIVGYGDVLKVQQFRVLSDPASAWFADWEEQSKAAGSLFAGSRSGFESVVAFGGRVLLTHRYFMRSKPVGHALLSVSPDGKLLRRLAQDSKADRARFGAHDVIWLPDARRGLVMLYGGRVLETFDAELGSRARVDGHALFKTFRPIASDGQGGVLWMYARTGQLLLSGPDDLDPLALAAHLDPISPPRAAKPAKPKKSSPIARPSLDLAVLDNDFYRGGRDQLLALDPRAFQPAPLLQYLSMMAPTVVSYASAIDREHPVLRVAMGLTAQVLTAEVCVHVRPGGPAHVRLPVAGSELDFPTQTPPKASAGTWLQAWYAATIARDRGSLERLASFADDCIYAQVEAYISHYRAALRALSSDPETTIRELEHARELAQPQHLRWRDGGVVRALAVPLFALLAALAKRDAAAFQSALIEALTQHKKYWGTPSRRLQNLGMIAWGPLAMCCIARDAGMPFEAETEYLLPSLIG